MDTKQDDTSASKTSEQSVKPEIKELQRPSMPWKWWLFGLVVFILIGAIYVQSRKNTKAPVIEPITDNSAIDAEEIAPTENQTTEKAPRVPNPDGQTFESAEMGISFYYADRSDGSKVTVKEEGDKTYVSTAQSSTNYTDGQWIQKFSKNPSDTLEMAIYESLLAEFSLDDCSVESIVNTSKDLATWEKAQIIISLAPAGDPDPAGEQTGGPVAVCPAPYTASNGISYFLMDKNHPDRFYFISIGQYGISADNSGTKMWQETLQVL